MSGDWWISILGLCQFLGVCGLSILAAILIKGNEKRKTAGKGKPMRLLDSSFYEWIGESTNETILPLKGLCHGSPVHFVSFCQLLALNRYGT